MSDAEDPNAPNQQLDVTGGQQDYVVHHETVEFNGPARCQSCGKENRACVLRQNDKTCLFCDFAKVDCIFTRRVERVLRKEDLSWDELINTSSQPAADTRIVDPTSIRASTASNTRPSKIQRRAQKKSRYVAYA